MRRSTLGNTGWEVSALALDVIGLGDEPAASSRDERRRRLLDLLHHAFDRGIDLVAVGGEAEPILGEALATRSETIRVVTEVTVGKGRAGAGGRDRLAEAISKSLERLGRRRLDLVLLRGAAAIDRSALEALQAEREAGRIERVGVTASGAGDALVAIRTEAIDVVQIPFNLLDQGALEEVFPEAQRLDVALLGRSPLAGGVLTPRRRQLPERLATLHRAVDRAERWARRNRLDLVTGALRFCLSQQELGAVVVGARTLEELDHALAAAEAPALPRHKLSDAGPLSLEDLSPLHQRAWDLAGR